MKRYSALTPLFLILLSICPMTDGLMAQPQDYETRVYDISYRDPHAIRSLVVDFLKGGRATVSPEFGTIIVTAPKDVHTVVAELIRKYDSPRQTFDFQIFLLRASREENGTPELLPEAIRSIVDEIASVTAYKSFEVISAPQLRTVEGKEIAVRGPGHELTIEHTRIQSDSMIRVEDFSVTFYEEVISSGKKQRLVNSQLGTSFDIADGETVVLGTSQMDGASGDALITLVTARIRK